MSALLTGSSEARAAPAAATVTEIASREAEFLWLTLQRMGVRRDDCHDVVQQVLLTVHQRLHTYDGRAPIRAWLYGICLRHASVHRRRAWVRREQPTEPTELPERTSSPPTPESELEKSEQRSRLEAMLDELDEDKRAVLVMFEIEERSCDDIARELGVAVGTVHSRLHAARRALRAVFDRWAAREKGGAR
ncbi:MAG: RNA polymerase sigma factor [Myxococcales bacterium]|nr:RNA polymerase sigma factor [Myxococcales bacterium]